MENGMLSSEVNFGAQEYMFINEVSMIQPSGIYNNISNINGDLDTEIRGSCDSSDAMLCFSAPCSSIPSDSNLTSATRSTEQYFDNGFNDFAPSEVLTSSSYYESSLFQSMQHKSDLAKLAPFPPQQVLSHVIEEGKLGLQTPIDVLNSSNFKIPDRHPLFGSRHVSCRSGGDGSKYLNAIHEIFTEIATDSLGNNSDAFGFDDRDERFVVETEAATFPKTDTESRKSELVSLLQIVDEQFGRFSDEIHTVKSAFHAATELDGRIHARFVLQTLDFFHRSLRSRIRNQILAMEVAERRIENPIRENDDLLETCLVDKQQWRIKQKEGRRDHGFWKPQKGLPDRSVSVLRAWMFQNFLHPYPKDSEKHILAARSGLTKSQVSNWFINARVRIWKPMIEKMYTEVDNGRKRNDSGRIGNSNW